MNTNIKSNNIAKILVSISVLAALVFNVSNPKQVKAVSADPLTSLLQTSTGGSNLSAGSATVTSTTMYIRGFIYPIVELGNCTSKQNCFDYCESLDNTVACAYFSEHNGFMKQGTAAAIDRVVTALLSGKRPGACNTLNACISYCDRLEVQDECSVFAKTYAYVSSGNVLGASTLESIPRGLLDHCNTTASCVTYCTNINSDDCLVVKNLPQSSNKSYITPEIQKLINSGYSGLSLEDSASAVNPSVKSVQDVDLDTIQEQLNQCLGNAQGSIINVPATPGSTFPPQQNLSFYNQQTNDCINQAQQGAPNLSESQADGEQKAQQGVADIQTCLSRLKSFDRGFQDCLSR